MQHLISKIFRSKPVLFLNLNIVFTCLMTGKKYTLSHIGHVLGIPYHSLRHQMRKINIIVKQKFNNISERRLARIVPEMLEENLRFGEL